MVYFFKRFTSRVAALFSFCLVFGSVFHSLANPPMNVLFLAIDDMKPIIGAYGNPLIQTPNMDRLAARGMLFKNAHCQYSVCGPSRASLMTGLMPEQTGVIGFQKMRGLGADGERNNPKGVINLVTIPQHFIHHGYETAASGKMNDFRCVGSITRGRTIRQDGAIVDDPPSWSMEYKRGLGLGLPPKTATREGATVKLAVEGPDHPASDFQDYIVATNGINQLRKLAAGDKPFFLGIGFYKPHLPFIAPKANWDQYDRDDFVPHPFQEKMKHFTPYTFTNILEMHKFYYLETDQEGNALPITTNILSDDQQKLLLHGYYACISHIDDQVGRILDELDTLKLTENTIVVLWGDHGFHLGDHNKWGKHSHLEQATRVPLIIRCPGFPEGQVTQSPAGLVDLFPTLCELAGLPQPVQPPNIDSAPTTRPLSGISLVPILKNPNSKVRTGIINLFKRKSKHTHYAYAYRTEQYRYTEWVDESKTIVARELYDYKNDSMETVNLARLPEHKALVNELSMSIRKPTEATGSLKMLNSSTLPTPSKKTTQSP